MPFGKMSAINCVNQCIKHAGEIGNTFAVQVVDGDLKHFVDAKSIILANVFLIKKGEIKAKNAFYSPVTMRKWPYDDNYS